MQKVEAPVYVIMISINAERRNTVPSRSFQIADQGSYIQFFLVEILSWTDP